jgi:hypothetical protein
VCRLLGRDRNTADLQHAGFCKPPAGGFTTEQIFLARTAEAKLSFADGEKTSLAHLRGHAGSGVEFAAEFAAASLMANGIWSQVVRVEMQVRA